MRAISTPSARPFPPSLDVRDKYVPTGSKSCRVQLSPRSILARISKTIRSFVSCAGVTFRPFPRRPT